MGRLVSTASGRSLLLEQDHSVGRSAISALRIDERYVSGQHALLRWAGEHWEIKDLGSRNGTFIDHQRIRSGEFHELAIGARVAFGKLEQEWTLVDVAAPNTMLVPADGGEPVIAEGDLVAIPSPAQPSATLYRSPDGSWVLEHAISTTPIGNQQTFTVDGKTWKLCRTDNDWKTSLATASILEVRHLQLKFFVSSDEEHVQLQASCGIHKLELGDRGHNYLLLTLARRRLADTREGLPETSCGWICQDDIAHDPSMAPPQLNVDVFRIRRQFAAAGILDAANIIERRPRTRQLRLGASRISIIGT